MRFVHSRCQLGLFLGSYARDRGKVARFRPTARPGVATLACGLVGGWRESPRQRQPMRPAPCGWRAGRPRALLEREQGLVVTAIDQLHVELATGAVPALVRLPDIRV